MALVKPVWNEAKILVWKSLTCNRKKAHVLAGESMCLASDYGRLQSVIGGRGREMGLSIG